MTWLMSPWLILGFDGALLGSASSSLGDTHVMPDFLQM